MVQKLKKVNHLARGSQKFLQAHSQSLNLQKILEAALKSVNQIEDQVELFQTLLPLETATGVNLDYWGDLFNVPDRPEDDEEYRQLIYAFIYIYYSEGDALSVQQSLKNAFFCTDVRVFDSSPANFEAVMFNPKTPINTTLLTQVLDLVPATGVKPSGVITIPSDPNPDGEFPGGGEPGNPVRYLEFSDNVEIAEANGFFPGTYEAFVSGQGVIVNEEASFNDPYSGTEITMEDPDSGNYIGITMQFFSGYWTLTEVDGMDPSSLSYEFDITNFLSDPLLVYTYKFFDSYGNEWVLSSFPNYNNNFQADDESIISFNGEAWADQIDDVMKESSEAIFVETSVPGFTYQDSKLLLNDGYGYVDLRAGSPRITLQNLEWCPASLAPSMSYTVGSSATIALDPDSPTPELGEIMIRRYSGSILVDGVDKGGSSYWIKATLTESTRSGDDWTFSFTDAELQYNSLYGSTAEDIDDGQVLVVQDSYIINTVNLGVSGDFAIESPTLTEQGNSLLIESSSATFNGVTYAGTAAMSFGYSPCIVTGDQNLDYDYEPKQITLLTATETPGTITAAANKPGHLPVKYLAKEAPQLDRTPTSLDWAIGRGGLPSPTADQAAFGYKIDENNDADYPDREVTNGWRSAFTQYMKYWADEVAIHERDRVQGVVDLLNPLDSKKVTHYDPVREDPAPSYTMPFIGTGTSSLEDYEIRSLANETALYFQNRLDLFMKYEVIDPSTQIRPTLATGAFSFSPSHMGIKKPSLHLFDGEFTNEQLNELERYDYQMVIGGFYVSTGNLSENKMLIFDRSNTINEEPVVTELDLSSMFVFDTTDAKKIRTCPLAHHRYGRYVYFLTGGPDHTYENAARGANEICVHTLYRVDLKNPSIENITSFDYYEVQPSGTRDANPPFWGLVAFKNLIVAQMPSASPQDGYQQMYLKYLPVDYEDQVPPWDVPYQDGYLSNFYTGQVEGSDLVPITQAQDKPAVQSILYDTPFSEESAFGIDGRTTLIYPNRMMAFTYDYNGQAYASIGFFTGYSAARDDVNWQLTNLLCLGLCTFIIKDKNNVEWKFVGTGQGGSVNNGQYGSGANALYAVEFSPIKMALGGGLELSMDVYRNGVKLASDDVDAIGAFAGYNNSDASAFLQKNPDLKFTRSTPGGISTAQIAFETELNPDTGRSELTARYTGGWQAGSRSEVNMEADGRLAILSRGQYTFSPRGSLMLGMGWYPVTGIYVNRKPFFHVYTHQFVSKEVTNFTYVEYDDPAAKLTVFDRTNAYGNYTGITSLAITSRDNWNSQYHYMGLSEVAGENPDNDAVVMVEIGDYSIDKIESQLTQNEVETYFDKVQSVFMMPEISTAMKMVLITPGNMPVRALANPGRRYSVCYPGYMGKTDYQLKYKITSPVITMTEADISSVTFEKIPDAVETTVNKIGGISRITQMSNNVDLFYTRGDTTDTVPSSQGQQYQAEISGWWDPYYIYKENDWSNQAAIQNPTQYLTAKEGLSPSDLNGLNVSDALDILYGKLSERNAQTFYTRRFTEVALNGSKNVVLTHDLDTEELLVAIYRAGSEITSTSTIATTDSETISITCANAGNIDVIIRG